MTYTLSPIRISQVYSNGGIETLFLVQTSISICEPAWKNFNEPWYPPPLVPFPPSSRPSRFTFVCIRRPSLFHLRLNKQCLFLCANLVLIHQRLIRFFLAWDEWRQLRRRGSWCVVWIEWGGVWGVSLGWCRTIVCRGEHSLTVAEKKKWEKKSRDILNESATIGSSNKRYLVRKKKEKNIAK